MDLREAVGLGVTIALVDLFSEGAENIISKFEEMEEKAGHGAHAIKDAIEGIKVGMGMLAAGGAILAPIVGLGDRAVEAAEKLERLKIGYESLAPESEGLFERIRQTAEELRLFPDEQLLEAGKHMLALGVAANKVPDLLRASGVAATVLGDSIQGISSKFQMLDTFARQGMINPRMLRSLGVTMGDLAAEGIRATGNKLRSSSEELVEAVGRVIEKRMGPAARKLAEGLPGIEADISRQFAHFYQQAGASGLVELKTKIVGGFLQVLQTLDLGKLGESFGQGVTVLYDALAPVGRAVKSIAMSIAEWLKEHPGFVKFVTAAAGFVGVALSAAGAVVVLGSALKGAMVAMKLLGTAALESLAGIAASLAPILPIVLGLAVIGGALYVAWERDFGGLQTTLTRWYNNIHDIVSGVVELFSSDEDGKVGHISKALHDKLVENGLWGVTKAIFLWGERLKEMFSGIWEGFKASVLVLAQVFGVVFKAITFVIDVVGKLLVALGLADEDFGGINQTTQQSLDLFKAVGEVVGTLIALWGAWQLVIGAASAAMAIYNGLVYAARAAQLLWNVAMTTNPILLVLMAIVAAVAVAIAYIDELRESFEDLVDIKPMRWLLKQAGVIPQNATDEDMDEALKGGREREYGNARRNREAAGRNDFVSRLMDNTQGVDYANMSPEEIAERNPATQIAAMGQPAAASAGGGPAPSKAPDQHLHVYLDGQQIHQSIVKHEEAHAERSGEW